MAVENIQICISLLVYFLAACIFVKVPLLTSYIYYLKMANVLLQAPSTDVAVAELTHASAEVSEIVFFLLGAMTIVEIIDAHQGFKLVTDNITTRKPRSLLWVVSDPFWIFDSYNSCFQSLKC